MKALIAKSAPTPSPDGGGPPDATVGSPAGPESRRTIVELAPEQLRRMCDPATLDFECTESLAELNEPPGQARAIEALRFGIEISGPGYNLFVLGPAGVGKRSTVLRVLESDARRRPAPSDWCYVNRFDRPHCPQVLSLPAGRGRAFALDVRHLIDELRQAVPAIFESDEYRARRERLDNEFGERESEAFGAIGSAAEEKGIALLRTPSGFGLAPVRNGEVIAPEEFEKISDEEKSRIGKELESLHGELGKVIRQLPQWAREKRERLRAMNREFVLLAAEPLIDELIQRYGEFSAVKAHLTALKQDVLDNGQAFRKRDEDNAANADEFLDFASPFRRYAVNLLVDNGESGSAPVVVLEHPTYQQLVGRVEHRERMGALLTDFTLIKPGALHRANGGYLVIDARKLLSQPFAWDALKRAIDSRQVRPDSIAQELSLTSTYSLEPEAVPLDLKVVLLGERIIYYLLLELDPDFGELFKIAADFEDDFAQDPDNIRQYASFVATVARREGLHPFHRDAAARLIERSTRLAEDNEKLSTHLQPIVDLMREADHLSRSTGDSLVRAEHVDQALAAQTRRVERVRSRLQEAILRNIVNIDTDGMRVGQINGLSVIDLHNHRFGQPTRITATVRLGEGEVIDIQREVDLGGAVHSKGVMILSSFIAMRYASESPLSLTASLAFEQTYELVEGDSASLAELCVLLSALGLIPLRQSLAVTGSVDQYGQVQAIGGVNEKIEGFFDICRARQLSGRQGVIIPKSNLPHLMLRSEVVDAVRAGQFHVYAASTVDDALELLTGLPVGEPDDEGVVPPESVNYLVASRLAEFTAIRKNFAAEVMPAKKKDEPA